MEYNASDDNSRKWLILSIVVPLLVLIVVIISFITIVETDDIEVFNISKIINTNDISVEKVEELTGTDMKDISTKKEFKSQLDNQGSKHYKLDKNTVISTNTVSNNTEFSDNTEVSENTVEDINKEAKDLYKEHEVEIDLTEDKFIAIYTNYRHEGYSSEQSYNFISREFKAIDSIIEVDTEE